ncbi:MAG: 4Fe-4S binding protein [Halobacteriota archaeon]|nr:4Fe-4S binding protein [Halobacteriota archaeon]
MKSESRVAVLNCKGCGSCDNVCPVDAIKKINNKAVIDYDRCDSCLKCLEVCMNKSIVVVD